MATNLTTLSAHQEVFALALEVGKAARELEQLQYRLTERLEELARCNGLSLEEIISSQQDSGLRA